MTSSFRTDGIPRRLVLATDLTARCDRAFDRAVELSRSWQAPLSIVHVTEDAERGESLTRPPSSWSERATPEMRQSRIEHVLEADLREAEIEGQAVVVAGDVARETIRIADEAGAGLIVSGIASGGPLIPLRLGSSVDLLIRGTRIPLLVVKAKVRRPYRKVIVAVDFSQTARDAMERALALFPTAEIILFHAYDVPHSGFAGDIDELRRRYRANAEAECAEFLAPFGTAVDRIGRLLEEGGPTDLLKDYVRYVGADLVVAGSHGRSALFDILLGSTAERILTNVPCDTLLIADRRVARGGRAA